MHNYISNQRIFLNIYYVYTYVILVVYHVLEVSSLGQAPWSCQTEHSWRWPPALQRNAEFWGDSQRDLHNILRLIIIL